MKKAYTIKKMNNDYLPFKVWWGECHICGAAQIHDTFEQMINNLDTHGRRWHTKLVEKADGEEYVTFTIKRKDHE